MKRLFSVLAVLLVTQTGLVVALSTTGPDYGAFESDEKLVAVDFDGIDELTIESSNGDRVILSKKEGGWTLPSLSGFPASETKIASLLEKVSAQNKGWPIATTSDAPARFKVDDEVFEKKLVFRKDGNDLAALFVGTTPTYRKVHVRPAGESAVYTASLTVHEIDTRAEDWESKDFLSRELKTVAALSLPAFKLEQHADDGSLLPSELKEGENVEKDKVRALVRDSVDVSYSKVLTKDEADRVSFETPILEYTVTVKDEGDLRYTFVKGEKEDDIYLRTSGSPYVFKVSKWTFERLRDAKRADLIKVSENQTEQKPES